MVYVRIGLLLLSSLSLSVADFIIEEGPTNISIVGYTGVGGDVVIPSSISNKPVNVIKTLAFKDQTNIISLTVPASIQTIEGSAFRSCYNLKNIYLTNGLTTIGDYAFEYCSNLETITIPDTVTTFGNIWGQIFLYNTNLKNVRLGNGITNIPGNTFLNCYSITNIKIGNNVKTIQANAFAQCHSLEEIRLPRGLNTIGIQAFWQNRSLKKIIIPASITNTASGWFGYCTNLAEVIFYGNAPNEAPNLFFNSSPTVFYLCGTTGWSNSFAGRPTIEITSHDIINNDKLGYSAPENVEKAIQDAQESARNDVLANPSLLGLYSSNQIDTARITGINQILGNPNQYNLYTANQIQNMAMGNLVLNRNTNGVFSLNYDIEQSTDLLTWSPYQSLTLPLNGLPTNKAFVRIKLKNSQ